MAPRVIRVQGSMSATCYPPRAIATREKPRTASETPRSQIGFSFSFSGCRPIRSRRCRSRYRRKALRHHGRMAAMRLNAACATPAGTSCPPGTASAQTTPPGSRRPPGTAPSTWAWRRSGRRGTRRTTSCRRTTQRCPAGTWSARTCRACRTCSRWGRWSGRCSWCPGSRRETGRRSGRRTWAGTCCRIRREWACRPFSGSRSQPGKARERKWRCTLIWGSKSLQGRPPAHETSSQGRGSRFRIRSSRHWQPRGRRRKGGLKL